ncbi:unnamed protein product [Orchesella dallaii]|uniref:Uncharacterized protein n=1 Tax=Orchesella dallaii TaxID=48710 RepID=A0ABP1RZU1_9HEXA
MLNHGYDAGGQYLGLTRLNKVYNSLEGSIYISDTLNKFWEDGKMSQLGSISSQSSITTLDYTDM